MVTSVPPSRQWGRSRHARGQATPPAGVTLLSAIRNVCPPGIRYVNITASPPSGGVSRILTGRASAGRPEGGTTAKCPHVRASSSACPKVTTRGSPTTVVACPPPGAGRGGDTTYTNPRRSIARTPPPDAAPSRRACVPRTACTHAVFAAAAATAANPSTHAATTGPTHTRPRVVRSAWGRAARLRTASHAKAGTSRSSNSPVIAARMASSLGTCGVTAPHPPPPAAPLTGGQSALPRHRCCGVRGLGPWPSGSGPWRPAPRGCGLFGDSACHRSSGG